jgi:hypothetical protein
VERVIRKKFKVLAVAASALIIASGGTAALNNYQQVRQTKDHIQMLEIQKLDLEKSTDQLEQKNTESQKLIEQQKKTEEDLKKQIEDLQAVKAEQSRVAALSISGSAEAAAAPQTGSGGGWHGDCRSQMEAVHSAVIELGLQDNWQYMEYIFRHESCGDPGRENSGGCRGLGQACPGSKLPCGPEDIQCQIAFFNRYAAGKGGWQASYNFWLANNWW